MAEGAERIRGLWEDEMFARQHFCDSPVERLTYEYRSRFNISGIISENSGEAPD